MAVNISVTRNPFGEGPNPVHNCLPFRFNIILERILKATYASYSVTFPAGITWPAFETFTFAGIVITTGTADWQLDLSVGGEDAADNFIAYLQGHPAFFSSCVFTKNDEGGGDFSVDIQWTTQVDIQNFVFDDSLLSTPMDWGGFNGNRDEYEDGWAFIYQIVNADTGVPITQLQKVYPIYNTLGNVTDIELDAHYALKHLTRTTIPDTSGITLWEKDETIGLNFYIKFGYRFTSGCDVRFARMKDSLIVWAINAAMNDYDGVLQYERYRYNGVNAGQIKYLTTRPIDMRICGTGPDWLWLNTNASGFHATILFGFTSYQFYDSVGVLYYSFNESFAPIYEDGTFIIKVGLDQINEFLTVPVDLTKLCYYTVRSVLMLGGVVPLEYTQTYTFRYDKTCCDIYDFYFLDLPGGYTKLQASKMSWSEVDQTFDEVCTEVMCQDYESNLLTKKFIVNSVATKKTRYEAKFRNSHDIVEYLTAFKVSETKLQLFREHDDTTHLRKVIIEAGSIRVFSKDERLVLQFTVIEELNKVEGE